MSDFERESAREMHQILQSGPEWPRAHSASPVTLPPRHAASPPGHARTFSVVASRRWYPGRSSSEEMSMPALKQSSFSLHAAHSLREAAVGHIDLIRCAQHRVPLDER